jgi:hypothetical protein
MVLLPEFSDSEPDAEPEVTDVYDPKLTRTSIVAFAWVFVGVTVTVLVSLRTDAV